MERNRFSALFRGQEVSSKLQVLTVGELRSLFSEAFPSLIAQDVALVGRKFAGGRFSLDTALYSDEAVAEFFDHDDQGPVVVEARQLFPQGTSSSFEVNLQSDIGAEVADECHLENEWMPPADHIHPLDALIDGVREQKENLLRILRPHRRTVEADELSLTDCSERNLAQSQNQLVSRRLSRLEPMGAMEELENRVRAHTGNHRDFTGVGERHVFAMSQQMRNCELMEEEATGNLGANPAVILWQVNRAYDKILKQGQVVSRGMLPLPRKAMLESPTLVSSGEDIGEFIFRLLPAGDAGAAPGMATIFIWRNSSDVQMTFGISFSDGHVDMPSAPRLWLQGRCWYRMDVPWKSIAEVVLLSGRLTVALNVLHWRMSSEIDLAMGARSARSLAGGSDNSFEPGSCSPRDDDCRSLSPSRQMENDFVRYQRAFEGDAMFRHPVTEGRAKYFGLEQLAALDSKQAQSALLREQPHLRSYPSPPSLPQLFY